MTLWIVVSCCESLPPAIVFRCFISFCVSQRPSVHCPLSHLFSMECELPFSFDEGIAEYNRYCDAAAHIQMEEPSTPETHAVSALADLGQTSSTETSPLSEHVCLTILRWPSLEVEPSIHLLLQCQLHYSFMEVIVHRVTSAISTREGTLFFSCATVSVSLVVLDVVQ